jgi:hypothetical protein
MKNLQYSKILSEDSSFQLIRTNPKLTGNLKLTVNESGDLWLNSIKANLELASDDYSRFPIDITQSLPANIYQFFKSGETPNEIIFDLGQEVDLTKTSNNFKDQFDFSNYFSGIKYFTSNKYLERLSYFAPIYLNKIIPDYFVVFKIKNPLNGSILDSQDEFNSGDDRAKYLEDLFKNATIVKTFDLTENSKIGRYLRDYLNTPGFPVSPLTVSFNQSEYTTWNGILVDSGILGSRGEFLYDQYIESSPLKAFEETITLGFERNGVIFPNIINLEFIFNDTSSNKYEFNRYVGLYINTVELDRLKVDLDRAFFERPVWENTPALKRKYFEYEDTTLLQSREEGVIIPIKDSTLNFIEFEEVFKNEKNLYFPYLKDKDSNIFLPNLNSPFNPDFSRSISIDLEINGTQAIATSAVPHLFTSGTLVRVVPTSTGLFSGGSYFITKISDFQFSFQIESSLPFIQISAIADSEIGSCKITLSNQKLDFGLFFGPERESFLQDSGFVSELAGRSSIAIKIKNSLNHLDEIKIYHPNGTQSDSIGKYDLITATLNYPLVPNPQNFYVFNDFDGVTGFDVFYFNGSGTASDIAIALAGCINGIRTKTFTAFSCNEYVFIKCNSFGNFDDLHKVEFNSPLLQWDTIEIGQLSGNSLIGSQIKFEGGVKTGGNRLVIDSGHFDKIDIQKLLVKTQEGWSRISKVSRYFDLVNESNLTTLADRITVINSYESNIVLALELEQTPSISYGEFKISKKYFPEFGLISIFPIKDLDFDYYTSEYLNFPIIDLYANYFIPEEVDLLFPGVDYQVTGGSIKIGLIQYLDGAAFTVSDQTRYSIISGNPVVSFDASSLNLTYAINDPNKELEDFPGFFILKDPDKIVPTQENIKLKYLNGLSETEYDFYKENWTSDFSNKSKIIPFINKWKIKGGKDSRDNPYRLNTEIVFSRNNFSPDHSDRTQNPNNFTHEWFYIESAFNYLDTPETIKQNDYYFDTPLDISLLISDPDYFINYFTYTPSIIQSGEKQYIGKTQTRYSTLFKNIAGVYETFFKGFKVSFKDIVDNSSIGPDGKPLTREITNRFENYKFSCLLKVVKEDLFDQTVPPIKYEIIEHTDFKFIVVIIQVALGSIDQIDDYWKIQNALTTITNDSAATSPNIFFADANHGVFASQFPFQTINGDYRILFDQNLVSNLNYNLLYSLKNKKFNSRLNNFSTIKLSSKLNLSIPGVSPNTIKIFENENISNYPSFLSDEIIRPNEKTFIGVKDLQTQFDYYIDSKVGLSVQNENPITGASDENLEYTSQNISLAQYSISSPFTLIYQNLGLTPSVFNSIINSYSFYVIHGGEKYYEKLFEKISFSKFKEYINQFSQFIEYSSYSLDQNGNSVKNTNANFFIEIEEPSQIEKISQIITKIDDARPAQYSFTPTIGFKYERFNLNNPVELNRYKGNYEPIAKDILFCSPEFEFRSNNIEKIYLANISLNTNILELFSIQNFNHIKVANTKILLLESDESFLPQYPLIGETPISQMEYFLLRSNWDWGFHRKYSNLFDSSPVSGALRVEEDENFIGKILNVPNEIEFESFETTILNVDETFESIDLDQIELAIKENASTVDLVINIEKVLTRFLIEDGISQQFNQFLVNSPEYIGNFNSIEEYVKEYIRLNIFKLYTISESKIFAKKNTLLTGPYALVFLNDSQRFQQEYSVLKNVQINNLDRLLISFRIQKNLNSGINISPKIKINFI